VKSKFILILAVASHIFLLNPSFANDTSLPGAEDLARRMIAGVDIVRLVLYKVFIDDYSKIYNDKGMPYCKSLAAASVNEIFNSHNEKTEGFFNKNKDIIVNGIISLGKNHPDLKRPITDALRVFVQASWMLSGNTKYYSDLTIFQKAMDRGIFIAGGEHPEPKPFLEMVEKLARKYNLFKD
jgi:hypothetical protein